MSDITLKGEQAANIPRQFVYRVALDGPDPLEFEMTRRLYRDREFPRFIDPLPIQERRSEERADLRFSIVDEPDGLTHVASIHAMPNRYTQAQKPMRLAWAYVSTEALAAGEYTRLALRQSLLEIAVKGGVVATKAGPA